MCETSLGTSLPVLIMSVGFIRSFSSDIQVRLKTVLPGCLIHQQFVMLRCMASGWPDFRDPPSERIRASTKKDPAAMLPGKWSDRVDGFQANLVMF